MDEGDARAWSRGEVEDQLKKILGDPEFARNRSVSNFLKFVVDETLDGRGSRLKAFTVATAVFNRDDNFDAQNNSIVRVQAARLRQLLHLYYSCPGTNDPVRISMPVGGYSVAFEKVFVENPRRLESAPAEPIMPPPELAETVDAAPSRRRAYLAFTLLLLAAATVIGGFILWLGKQAPRIMTSETFATDSDRPILALNDAGLKNASPPVQAMDARLRDTIERGIAAFDNAVVIQRPKEQGDGGGVPKLSYSLAIEGSEESDGKLRYSFKLLHAPSGSLIWSRVFTNIPATEAAVEQVGIVVVRAVGDVYGAINTDALKRSRPQLENPRGYFCVLAVLNYFKDHTPAKQIKARDCLEAESVENPEDARISSMHAAFLVRRYLDATTENAGLEDLRRARQLARRAYDREPQAARAVYMMFLTRFYDKGFDEAFVAAQKTLELNPNSSIMTAQIGAAYITRGQYERGDALLAEMAKMNEAPPGFLSAYLALSTYMRGDEAKFLEFCKSAGGADGALGALLQIVSCGKGHDSIAKDLAVEALRKTFPRVAADIPAALDRYAFIPEIQTKLLADLAQAGLVSTH